MPFAQKLLACLAGLTILAMAPPVAADTLKKIKDSGTITLGVRESSIPLSYLDDKQQPIGYHIDLCMRIVNAVKTKLALPGLKVQHQTVTSQNRIPLVTNGTVDLECGSTSNNQARQKQVAFAPTTFVTNVRMAVKKASGITSLAQLNGKPVATTTGTTSVQLLRAHEKGKGIDFKEVYGKDHADAFLLLETTARWPSSWMTICWQGSSSRRKIRRTMPSLAKASAPNPSPSCCGAMTPLSSNWSTRRSRT